MKKKHLLGLWVLGLIFSYVWVTTARVSLAAAVGLFALLCVLGGLSAWLGL